MDESKENKAEGRAEDVRGSRSLPACPARSAERCWCAIIARRVLSSTRRKPLT